MSLLHAAHGEKFQLLSNGSLRRDSTRSIFNDPFLEAAPRCRADKGSELAVAVVAARCRGKCKRCRNIEAPRRRRFRADEAGDVVG
jgi:hypothetical protein